MSIELQVAKKGIFSCPTIKEVVMQRVCVFLCGSYLHYSFVEVIFFTKE